MSEEIRRSKRANKGVPPSRYTNPTDERTSDQMMPSLSLDNTEEDTQDCSLDELLERTIVYAGLATEPHMRDTFHSSRIQTVPLEPQMIEIGSTSRAQMPATSLPVQSTTCPTSPHVQTHMPTTIPIQTSTYTQMVDAGSSHGLPHEFRANSSTGLQVPCIQSQPTDLLLPADSVQANSQPWIGSQHFIPPGQEDGPHLLEPPPPFDQIRNRNTYRPNGQPPYSTMMLPSFSLQQGASTQLIDMPQSMPPGQDRPRLLEPPPPFDQTRDRNSCRTNGPPLNSTMMLPPPRVPQEGPTLQYPNQTSTQNDQQPLSRPSEIAQNPILSTEGQYLSNASNQNASILELQRQIHSLQLETDQYRARNILLYQTINHMYERERHMLQRTSMIGSGGSCSPSSGFRGFSPIPTAVYIPTPLASESQTHAELQHLVSPMISPNLTNPHNQTIDHDVHGTTTFPVTTAQPCSAENHLEQHTFGQAAVFISPNMTPAPRCSPSVQMPSRINAQQCATQIRSTTILSRPYYERERIEEFATPQYTQQYPINARAKQSNKTTQITFVPETQSVPTAPPIFTTNHPQTPYYAASTYQVDDVRPMNTQAHIAANPQPPPNIPTIVPSVPVQAPASYYVDRYNSAGICPVETTNPPTAPTNETATGRPWQRESPKTAPQNAKVQFDAVVPEIQQTQYARSNARDPYLSSTRRKVLDLPQFSGRPEDWPFFICSYETTTREYGYTDLENMGRLQKALVGEAKTRARGILIRPEHVARTVKALAKAFGRPETLAESQLNEIYKLPRISENRPEQLISFSITVDSMVSLFEGPATEHLLWNSILLGALTSKLPTSDQRIWAAVARHLKPSPSIRDFAKWLEEVADDVANMKSFSVLENSQNRARESRPLANRGKHVLLNVKTVEQRTEKCAYCRETHPIHKCNAFQKLSVSERLAEIRKRPMCYYCLSPNHLLPACDDRKACGIGGCERRHHYLLHQPIETTMMTTQSGEKTSQQQSDECEEQKAGNEKALNVCHLGRSDQQKLYYRVVPVVLHGSKHSLQTFALFDEGSSVSLIDAELADKLQLIGETQTLSLQFVSGTSITQSSRNVALGISGIEPDAVRFDIDAVQTTNDLSLPLQTVDRREILEKNPHLDDVPFISFENVRPKILLGLEHHYLGTPLESRMSEHLQSLVAARTRLGWVLYGGSGRSFQPGVVLHARQPEVNDEPESLENLHALVRQHFTTEDFGVKMSTRPIISDADMRANSILESTTKRCGSKFETGLLWKRDDIILPESYLMALNRLKSVEAKMRRDPEYARQYRLQIQSYVEKGYARKLKPDEATAHGPRTWYLPHFAVQNENKPGKFRLVFDAAATSHHVSLNEMLLSGPDLNVPLTRLLYRFRLGAIGVCADIREMFLQVMVRQEDQDAQRFL